MYGGLVAAALTLTAQPSTVIPIVRLVGPPDNVSGLTVSVQRGTEAGLRWFIDTNTIADARERAMSIRTIRECGDDNRCVIARLRQFGIDRGVYVVANVGLRPALLTVEILDGSTGRTAARVLAEAEPADLRAAVAGAVQRALQQAGHRFGGRLEVRVVPPDAQVSLRAPDGRTIDPYALLPPGGYSVSARRDGYEPGQRPVEVLPRRSVDVSLQLEPADSIWQKWWLWTALGVAVVGGAVVTGVLVSGSDDVTVCHPVGDGTC